MIQKHTIVFRSQIMHNEQCSHCGWRLPVVGVNGVCSRSHRVLDYGECGTYNQIHVELLAEIAMRETVNTATAFARRAELRNALEPGGRGSIEGVWVLSVERDSRAHQLHVLWPVWAKRAAESTSKSWTKLPNCMAIYWSCKVRRCGSHSHLHPAAAHGSAQAARGASSSWDIIDSVSTIAATSSGPDDV